MLRAQAWSIVILLICAGTGADHYFMDDYVLLWLAKHGYVEADVQESNEGFQYVIAHDDNEGLIEKKIYLDTIEP